MVHQPENPGSSEAGGELLNFEPIIEDAGMWHFYFCLVRLGGSFLEQMCLLKGWRVPYCIGIYNISVGLSDIDFLLGHDADMMRRSSALIFSN